MPSCVAQRRATATLPPGQSQLDRESMRKREHQHLLLLPEDWPHLTGGDRTRAVCSWERADNMEHLWSRAVANGGNPAQVA